jgi:hypothetical protein
MPEGMRFIGATRHTMRASLLDAGGARHVRAELLTRLTRLSLAGSLGNARLEALRLGADMMVTKLWCRSL